MSSSKKITSKLTLRQVFICLRPRTPYPQPLHTVYVYNIYSTVYGTYSHRERGKGGELNQREG
jgi:hypothetical protein